MPSVPQAEITELLLAWAGGDDQALSRFTPRLYQELHRLAHAYMRRERPQHTLQTTALINEAYLRLIDSRKVRWQNRAHFVAIAAKLMRRILVDYARSRQALKRGAAPEQVSLDQGLAVSPAKTEDYAAIDQALNALAELDPRKCQVIELRFFGGLSVRESAEVLEVSPDTVMRDWRLARVWMHRYLNDV